jgi:hypothetical protein
MLGINVNTFTKLRNGGWGVKSEDPIKVGDIVNVTRKDGSTATMRIDRVLWRADDGSCHIAASTPVVVMTPDALAAAAPAPIVGVVAPPRVAPPVAPSSATRVAAPSSKSAAKRGAAAAPPARAWAPCSSCLVAPGLVGGKCRTCAGPA